MGGRKSTEKMGERLLVNKSAGGGLSAVLVHPSKYAVGMSSLGYQVVWRVFNDTPDVWVERAFAGDSPGKPPRTIESGRHASDFDIVAFSLSFEPDAVNMCRFLSDAGIPLEARKRHAKDPIVIAGGIVPTLNPEPYADFIDLFVIGEAEETLPELLERLIEFRGATRTKLLTEAAQTPGVYSPRLYKVEYDDSIKFIKREPVRAEIPERVRRRWVSDVDRHPAHSVFYAPKSEFGDMGLIEISRGCGRGCRFCAAGHIVRPPRHRSLESLEADVKFLAQHFDCLGLVSSTATDHPDINKLLDMLSKHNLAVSFASLPAAGLSEKVLEAAAKRSKTLTIAPEAGTERLRKVVNKNITNDDILDTVFVAAKKGIKRIKMYFLVGLPTESGDDVAAIGELVSASIKAIRQAKKNVEIVVSLAPFIPKAHTPFMLHPMENRKVIESRLLEIRGMVRKISGAIVRKDSVYEAVFQGILARGDRRAGKLIKKAFKENSIKRALKDLPQWASDTLYAKRTIDLPLPWDFIEDGIGNSYLIDEYHQGLLARLSKPCRPPKCRNCEACEKTE